MKTCFDFQFDCGWIFALKTAKIGGRWKLFFFPFLAKSKKLLIWTGKHLTTTVNSGEQEAIRNIKKPDVYRLSWTPVNAYDNCSIVLLSVGPEVQILSGTPESTAASLFSGFAAFFCFSFSRWFWSCSTAKVFSLPPVELGLLKRHKNWHRRNCGASLFRWWFFENRCDIICISTERDKIGFVENNTEIRNPYKWRTKNDHSHRQMHYLRNRPRCFVRCNRISEP